MNPKTLPLVLLLGLAVLPACKRQPDAGPTGLGKQVAEGPARAVTPSPDGAYIAFVAEPKPARELGHGDLPDNVWIGTAKVVPSTGGAPVTLGGGVSTLAGGILFDSTSARVMALTNFKFKSQSGTLVIADLATGNVRALAPGVSFFGFSPDGRRIAYVANDKLFLGPADGALPAELMGAATTFEFSPDSSKILYRRKLMQDGSLSLADVPSPGAPVTPAKTLARLVAEYRWSPAGDRVAFTARAPDRTVELFVAPLDGEPKKLGSGVPSFAFSRDGAHLAFVGDVTPEKQFGDMMLLAAGAATPVKLGEKVNDWGFSPDSRQLAWVEKYQPTGRVGTLAYAAVGPDPKPTRLGDEVMSFRWSRTGSYLAHQRRTLVPIFSVDLFVEKVGGDGPVKVAAGVFGYDFGKNDETVIFRTNCIREGRECILRTVPTSNLSAPATKLASGVHTFEFNRTLDLLMLTYVRVDMDALDLSVMPADGSRAPVIIDRTLAHGTKWVGNDRIAYAKLAFKQEGVFVADVTTLPGTAPSPTAAER